MTISRSPRSSTRSRRRRQTGLGIGHFITTRLEFTDQHGELVATMLFRILKFKPRTEGRRRQTAVTRAAAATPDPSTRPRPALTQDNRFFFEGAKQHKLLIQRCTDCGTCATRPARRAPTAGPSSGTRSTASGRGTIYSFVVNHYPQVPAFDYPLVVALVELEEGTRLVANVRRHHPRDGGHRHAGGGRASRTSTRT